MVSRLHAQAQAIDAEAAQIPQIGRVQIVRVGLQRDFCPWQQVELLVQRGQNSLDLLRRQHAGCATAEEHCMDRLLVAYPANFIN